MQSLKNVTTAINYLTKNKVWISTWEKCMEAQNTIAQIVTMCLAFNQNLICMSRIFIQGEVRYRNLSFQTWYILTAIIIMKITYQYDLRNLFLFFFQKKIPTFTTLHFLAKPCWDNCSTKVWIHLHSTCVVTTKVMLSDDQKKYLIMLENWQKVQCSAVSCFHFLIWYFTGGIYFINYQIDVAALNIMNKNKHVT